MICPIADMCDFRSRRPPRKVPGSTKKNLQRRRLPSLKIIQAVFLWCMFHIMHHRLPHRRTAEEVPCP